MVGIFLGLWDVFVEDGQKIIFVDLDFHYHIDGLKMDE